MSTFNITYWVSVTEGEHIEEKIDGMCLEQTSELPRGVLGSKVEEEVVGKPISSEKIADQKYEVVIAWPLADLGDDISQFLNILYGNISMQSGIRILKAEWAALFSQVFRGPASGISTIRERYNISDRPLSATALKPLGSSSDELAALAYQFAKGGIDIIKDDHGLADQEFAPFEERVDACVDAIRRAKESSDHRSYYYPNVTAFASETIERYKIAAAKGADGVLLCPHIAGLETMDRLACMDIDLPVIAHPSFSGSLTSEADQGLIPAFLYGQLWRALGADFAIYPNKGGRFSFTTAECEEINKSARDNRLPFKSSFPMPGGGIKLENVSQWLEAYGNDTVFLIGGNLYEHPDGIEVASKELRDILTQTEE